MPRKVITLPFPLGGVSEKFSYGGQPPLTTPRALNVRPDGTLEGRERGGKRPGLAKHFGYANPGSLRPGYNYISNYATPGRMLNTVRFGKFVKSVGPEVLVADDFTSVDTNIWEETAPAAASDGNPMNDSADNYWYTEVTQSGVTDTIAGEASVVLSTSDPTYYGSGVKMKPMYLESIGVDLDEEIEVTIDIPWKTIYGDVTNVDPAGSVMILRYIDPTDFLALNPRSSEKVHAGTFGAELSFFSRPYHDPENINNFYTHWGWALTIGHGPKFPFVIDPDYQGSDPAQSTPAPFPDRSDAESRYKWKQHWEVSDAAQIRSMRQLVTGTSWQVNPHGMLNEIADFQLVTKWGRINRSEGNLLLTAQVKFSNLSTNDQGLNSAWTAEAPEFTQASVGGTGNGMEVDPTVTRTMVLPSRNPAVLRTGRTGEEFEDVFAIGFTNGAYDALA